MDELVQDNKQLFLHLHLLDVRLMSLSSRFLLRKHRSYLQATYIYLQSIWCCIHTSCVPLTISQYPLHIDVYKKKQHVAAPRFRDNAPLTAVRYLQISDHSIYFLVSLFSSNGYRIHFAHEHDKFTLIFSQELPCTP